MELEGFEERLDHLKRQRKIAESYPGTDLKDAAQDVIMALDERIKNIECFTVNVSRREHVQTN